MADIVSKQFYVDGPDSEKLRRLAKRRGVRQADLLRELIDREIKQAELTGELE